MSNVSFKIKSTPENVNHTRNFTPAFDGTQNAFIVGSSVAYIKENWIVFEVSGATAAYFGTKQANKQGFLKHYGY